MDQNFYLQYAAVEDHHWWFVARRQIIHSVIRRLQLPPHAQILEVGCGTGGNLAMLSQHGDVSAMEVEAIACELANQRQLTLVKPGRLPDLIPFEKDFDLILALDVIEHIPDDLAALKALYSRLKSGGWLIITVPAYQFLWSQHDEINHHQRRYRRRQLSRLIQSAGFHPTKSSYFNTFLFPLVFLTRMYQKILKVESQATISDDLKLPSPLLNRILTKIFASERYFLPLFSFPWGVSILVIARKIGDKNYSNS